MRSARHRSHQSRIDSRSDLPFMKNMAVHVLIMSVQKSLMPLARLQLLQCPCPRASFLSDKIVIIRDLTLSSLPTIGFLALTTGKHDLTGNHTC